jgi:hypothetical protein
MTVKEKLSDVGMIDSEVIVEEDEYLFGGIVGCNSKIKFLMCDDGEWGHCRRPH